MQCPWTNFATRFKAQLGHKWKLCFFLISKQPTPSSHHCFWVSWRFNLNPENTKKRIPNIFGRYGFYLSHPIFWIFFLVKHTNLPLRIQPPLINTQYGRPAGDHKAAIRRVWVAAGPLPVLPEPRSCCLFYLALQIWKHQTPRSDLPFVLEFKYIYSGFFIFDIFFFSSFFLYVSTLLFLHLPLCLSFDLWCKAVCWNSDWESRPADTWFFWSHSTSPSKWMSFPKPTAYQRQLSHCQGILSGYPPCVTARPRDYGHLFRPWEIRLLRRVPAVVCCGTHGPAAHACPRSKITGKVSGRAIFAHLISIFPPSFFWDQKIYRIFFVFRTDDWLTWLAHQKNNNKTFD